MFLSIASENDEVPSKPQEKGNISRKQSFLKQNNAATRQQGFQLPRFYSSDQKNSNKNLVILQTHNKKIADCSNTKVTLNTRKKQISKYSKTQKNQTPTKIEPLSLKKIKVVQQKWGDILQRSHQSRKEVGKQKNKKSSIYEEPFEGELKIKFGKNEQKVQINTNLNNIRYKKGGHKKIVELMQTQLALKDGNKPISGRQSKVMTQEASKFSMNQTKNKFVYNNNLVMFQQYLKETQTQTNEVDKGRTLSSFDHSTIIKKKIGFDQKEHLLKVMGLIKKLLKNPNNLDYSESYIVAQKIKYQKIYYSAIDDKNKKYFRHFIILIRFSFYLCAHLIMLQINAKILLGLFTKMLQNQSILLNILGISQEKQLNKFYSISKVSSKQISRKPQNQLNLIVQSKPTSLQRNNDIMKKILEGIFSKKTLPFHQLFMSLLVASSQIDSFDFINYLDKTLKWEILKMPTFPFLPQSQQFQHFLILDLDETLIHFDPQNQTFHVRPYAQQFLTKIAPHYQITIFTAATKDYADQIINQIDRSNIIKHRLYRNHLTFLDGESIKDISLLGRNMKTSVIVDNLQSNFRLHPQNGVLIKSWYGGNNDKALHNLQTLLVKLIIEYPEDLRIGLQVYKNYIQSQITEKQRSLKIKYQI